MHIIKNIATEANLGSNGAREMELDLLDGRYDGEYNGVGFVGIFEIFLSFGTIIQQTMLWY